MVEERHALRKHGTEVARGVGRRQPEPGIGLSRLGDDLHPLTPGEMHHRRVFRKAVHEKRRHAPIAGMQMGTGKQCAADAAAALALEHRNAELGMAVGAREMGNAEQMQIVIRDSEYRVLREIDALDVFAHRVVAERRAEAQPAVVRAELQEMLEKRGPLGTRQLSDGNVHAAIRRKDCSSQPSLLNAARAAASVASISALPCAAETKPAS